jgi:hypothetical protein
MSGLRRENVGAGNVRGGVGDGERVRKDSGTKLNGGIRGESGAIKCSHRLKVELIAPDTEIRVSFFLAVKNTILDGNYHLLLLFLEAVTYHYFR